MYMRLDYLDSNKWKRKGNWCTLDVVDVIGQFKITTEEYVVITAIIGFI
jgi:hypothetical protein